MAVPQPQGFITSAEVGARLGVRSATVTRWHRDGFLVAVAKLPGRTGALLFDPRDVEQAAGRRRRALLEPQRADPPTAPRADRSEPAGRPDPGPVETWECPDCRTHVHGTYDDLDAHRGARHGWRG